MQQVGTTTFVHIATTVYAYRYLNIYALYVLIRHPLSFGWFVRESNEKTNRWFVRFASYIRTAPPGHESIQVLGPGPGYIYLWISRNPPIYTYIGEPPGDCKEHSAT